MQKLFLVSILVATALIPVFASKGQSTRQSVLRSIFATLGFCLLYAVGLLFVYPGLKPPPKKR